MAKCSGSVSGYPALVRFFSISQSIAIHVQHLLNLDFDGTRRTMRIAIIGAGAMGTLLGHGLCRARYDVSMMDLPNRIKQIQDSGGLTVVTPEGIESTVCPSAATTDFASVGIHDIVFLATKSQDLPALAPQISKLADKTSTVVTIQNGFPWWYLQNFTSAVQSSRIECLDPKRILERSIEASQIVGCVAYPAALMEPTGRVCHIEGYRMPVGELDGSSRQRTRQLASALCEAGFKSRIIDDIRSEIWLKAWGAIPINPISALTRATMAEICTFPLTRDLVRQMMFEVQAVAEALGATFRHTVEKRIDGAQAVGDHKTSMLQDVESRRELEVDALLLSVIELAAMVGKDVPTVKTIYACTALLNKNLLLNHGQKPSQTK